MNSWLGSTLSVAVAAMAWAAGAEAAPVAASIPMHPTVTAAVPGTLILQTGHPAQAIQSLHVVRQFSPAALRANPVIQLGGMRANLTKVLTNPRSPINLGQRLAAIPNVKVTGDTTELVEVDQGLLLHHYLTFRLPTGACTDQNRRAVLGRAGVSCFADRPPGDRSAAFSNPRDPHFVKDAQLRARALQRANASAVSQHAQIAQHLQKLKANLADAAERQKLVGQLGSDAVERLAHMSDHDLTVEMLNTGDRKVEQVMFVPKLAATRLIPTVKALQTTPVPAEIQAQKRLMFIQAVPAKSPFKAAVQANLPGQGLGQAKAGGAVALMDVLPPPDGPHDFPLDRRVFLAGFTIGHDYEWGQRIETTIDWCLIGCSETYYIEGNVGFSYYFGLRFPIEMTGNYHFQRSNNQDTATVSPRFQPINGGPSDYRATGLPEEFVLDGKEVVAQVGVNASAGFELPIVGAANFPFSETLDFTQYLPGVFQYGQFRPPYPGDPNPPSVQKVFDQLDLLGNNANVGIAGLQVFPAVQVSLISNSLNFTLHDYANKNQETAITGPDQNFPVAVDQNIHESAFAIGNPVYNLAFQIEPGIDVHAFVDIDVWSDSWDWEIWFPQLAIQVPQGGIDFSCHAGTKCVEYYEGSPIGVSESMQDTLAAANSANAKFQNDANLGKIDQEFREKVPGFKSSFEAQWIPQCVDETCKTGIRLISTGTYYFLKQKHDADPKLTWAAATQNGGIFVADNIQAQELTVEAKQRAANKAYSGWEILASAIWSKQCADGFCLAQIKSLAAEMKQAAVDRQVQYPDESQLHSQGVVGPKYGLLFKQEVDHSKLRVSGAPMSKAQALTAYDCTPVPGAPGRWFCPVSPAPSMDLCKTFIGREVQACLPPPPKNAEPVIK